MTREELNKKVSDLWCAYLDRPENKSMSKTICKIPHLYFVNYLSKNSYGYKDNDVQYVKNMLGYVGVDEETAKQFFDEFIDKQYPQSYNFN